MDYCRFYVDRERAVCSRMHSASRMWLNGLCMRGVEMVGTWGEVY